MAQLKNILLFLAGIISLPAAAQQTKILTADKHNEYGLVYTLPLTSLSITVTAERTVGVAGPYYQYAKKFIGTDKVLKEDFESWRIKNVSVTPYGVPDPDNRYLMQLKSGVMTYIGVDEDGMLLSINRKPEARQLPESTADSDGESIDIREYLQYVGGDFLASQSSVKQAQMLAESLMEIRDARISLTRGTAETMPTDGRQLELMLNSLAHQEESLMRAFTGATTTSTVTRTFTFLPGESGQTVLFRMSDFAGFVDADDYSGDPVYVVVDITDQGELPVNEKGEEKRLPKDAVAYNIPGAARIKVVSLGKTLFDKEFEMAQFGVVFGLNPAVFSDKKDPSYAVFNPATGALVEIGSVSDIKD